MIICQCNVVSDRTVTGAVHAGARTVAQVCQATGAARACGSCVFAVKRLVTSHRPTTCVSCASPQAIAS
jgi:NAD(P)H-nitrite reductase large subunit